MRRRDDLAFRPSRLGRVLLAGMLVASGMLGLTGCGTEPGPPSVQLGDTVMTGVYETNGIAAFLGLPFAEPPVGERRWARPVPWQPNGQSIDASTFAPACMQTDSGVEWYRGMMARVGIDPNLMVVPEYSEDCLYLNVWTDLEANEPLPVMIYIHGGGNTGGWSYEPNYHGEQLAQQGMVVVSVAYRLGIFGWLNHPEMTIKNPALHDLAMSLAWVREHIAAFGGDPERLTVVGESAGADNAIHLAISPLSQGRFRGLIQQSGGWSFDEGPDTPAAEAHALEFQRSLLGETGSLDGLRGIPSAQLLEAAAAHGKTISIEPLNHHDAPGYFLSDLDQALGVIDLVGAPNLKLMFDCYHIQILHGDLIRRLTQSFEAIGHIQFASVPSRGAPDAGPNGGEVNYQHIFGHIASLGYDAPLGAEYRPEGGDSDGSLGWLAHYRR